MGRRLLFILGLAFTAYGGWVIHREIALNNFCNAQSINPKRGFTFSPQCLNIVWPYSEGFACLVFGAVLVVGALAWSRRAMAGERQYLRDLRSGKLKRDREHFTSDNYSPKAPGQHRDLASRDQSRDTSTGP